MSSENGTVAAKALEVLATLGHDRKEVAVAVACHRRTVARWEAGQFSPNRRNRTRLRAFIGELLMVELAGPSTPNAEARRKRLNLAAESLMTTAELEAARVDREAFEAEMKAKYEAIVAERKPPSVTYLVSDPFAVVDQPAPLPF